MGNVGGCQGNYCGGSRNGIQSPSGDWESKQTWQETDGKIPPITPESNMEASERTGKHHGCTNCDSHKSPSKRVLRRRGPASSDPEMRSPTGRDVGKGITLRSRKEFQPQDLDTPAAKHYNEHDLQRRFSNESSEMDSADGSMTTTTATGSLGGSVPDSADLKSKKQNVFTDPMNWIDPEAVFAWNITVHNAMTKEKEEISVYNNDTVGSVKKTFVRGTGCDPSIRLFHLVGTTCQELNDSWELRHCMRNRSSLIACEEDLPSLLGNAAMEPVKRRQGAEESKPSHYQAEHENSEGGCAETFPEISVAPTQPITGRS